MAEHRLERVIQYADQVVLLPGPGEAPRLGTPAEIMAVAAVSPPVVGPGGLAGWSTLPLPVRDARRRAAPLRQRLADAAAARPDTAPGEPPDPAPSPARRRLFRRPGVDTPAPATVAEVRD